MYFLFNDELLVYIVEGKSVYNFQYEGLGYWIIYKKWFEEVIGLLEIFVRDVYGKFGFVVYELLYYGLWSGWELYLSFQDIVIVIKIVSQVGIWEVL